MKRKIIQIATAMVNVDEDLSYAMTVILCNDHTAWYFRGFDDNWQQFPPVPQDQEISIKNIPAK